MFNLKDVVVVKESNLNDLGGMRGIVVAHAPAETTISPIKGKVKVDSRITFATFELEKDDTIVAIWESQTESPT